MCDVYLLLLELGDLRLGLGDLPVHLGDLLEEIVLGGLDIVPLGRTILRGGRDRLHLRLISRLLEKKKIFVTYLQKLTKYIFCRWLNW